MTTTAWTDVRTLAITAFRGELPTAATEQALIDAFEQEPLAVIHARDDVIEDFKQGKCRSGWAVWKARIANVQAPRDATADLDTDRPKAIKAAEAWIRNAGGYIDREDELVAELFDPEIGRLKDWPDLEPRMVALWTQQRPRFIAAEAAAYERQHAQAATRNRIHQALKGTGSPIDLELHAQRIAAEIDRARTAQDAHRDDWLDQLAAAHVEDDAA